MNFSLMQNAASSGVQTYRSFAFSCLIAFNISLSSFYFGYTVIYYAAIPSETVKRLYHIEQDSATAEGMLNGAVSVGGLLGSCLSSLLLARFSRRNSLLLLDISSVATGILIYIPNFYSFLAFRTIQGVIVGAFSSISPLIIREITPIEISGTTGHFSQLNLGFGVFFGQLLSYVLKKWSGDESGEEFWVLVFGFSLITQVIQIIVLLFIFPYETPKYLLLNNQKKACEDLIRAIYRDDQFEQIYQQKIEDITPKPAIAEMGENSFNPQELAPLAAVVACLLTSLQQLSGINSMVLYAAEIANKSFTGEIVLLIPIIINFSIFISTILSSALLHRLGRKTLIVGGFSATAAAAAIITVGFSGSEGSLSLLILFGIVMFVVVYGASLGPVGWAYLPEIVPPSAMPYIVACNWFTYSLVAFFFPIITEHLLSGNPCLLFLFFACVCGTGALFNWRYMIETKDKTEKAIMSEYKAAKFC